MNAHVPDAFSKENWTAAEAMPLRCEPHSAEALALVDSLLAGPLLQPPGKTARPTTLARRRKALGALLADLLKLHAAGLVGSHGMGRDDFPAKALGFGFDVFSPLKDAMVTAGLLAFSPGKPRWHTSPGFDGIDRVGNLGGWVARFRLTPLALGHVEAAGVPLDAWGDHWRRAASIKPQAAASLPLPPLLALKASSGWSGGAKRRGEALPIDFDHPTVQAALADLAAHNAFMSDLGVDGIDFLGLRRVFNEGDMPEKLWRSGGRFYSIVANGFGTAYENLPGHDRRRSIRFAGRPVGEADMSASQLRLLYALQDVEIPAGLHQDPYDLDGLSREAVKAVVAQMLGSGKPRPARWSADAKRDYAKRNPERALPDDFPFATYREATLAAHPILSSLGQAGVPTSLDLQFVESEVIRRAMGSLRDRGIGSLPVHDSLIVDENHLAEGSRALEDAFGAQVALMLGKPTGHRPKVTHKAPFSI